MSNMDMRNSGVENIVSNFQRTWTEINLDAVLENIRNMSRHIAPDTKMLGVIKTDGYGHGAVPIAQCLEPLDCMYGFATATAEEAIELRNAGIEKPIMILGYTFPNRYEQLIAENIRLAVFREDTIQQLAEAARKANRTAKVHIKVDTGMSRIGISPDDNGMEFVKRIMEYPEIEIEGIFTHFAKADETDKTNAISQMMTFRAFVQKVEAQLELNIPIKHCSNSAAILEMPEANMDMVRPGICLYGLYPSEEVSREAVSLTPALSWYSHIVYIKTIHEGQSVSYGGLFTAKKDMRVATIPLGYGDGYPRSLSGKGYVLIRGQKAPILGRVCMDQFMVDVTDIPEAAENDKVTLLGVDGESHISAEELGALSGRFNYELVCDIGTRVPRVYFKQGQIVTVKDYHNDYI